MPIILATQETEQEDRGLRPAWGNSSRDPILKKTITKKRTSGVAQGAGPEFKLQYHKNQHQTNKRIYTILSSSRR
jgi:hypothetical protein